MMNTEEVRGPDVLLAVEVAHTTQAYELGRKADLYARHGVRELWVIDARTLNTHVHRDPARGRWNELSFLGPEAILAHPAAPGFAVRLADL